MDNRQQFSAYSQSPNVASPLMSQGYPGMGISAQRVPPQMLQQNQPQSQQDLQYQQYQYQQYLQQTHQMQQRTPQMQQQQLTPQQQQQRYQQQQIINQRAGQPLSDEQFDRVLQSQDSQRITISNERRFSLDSELDSLSDNSINNVLASKDAFLDYVIKGPVEGDNNDFDYLDEDEGDGRRRKEKTETLAEFLKNTGPEPLPANKKKRGTGIFRGFGNKNSKNVKKQQVKKDPQTRPPQQQPVNYGPTSQQPKYQPLSIPYDPFVGKIVTNGESDYANHQQAMLMARNAAQRGPSGTEDSRAVQQLAEMLVTTSVEEPHPAKYLGQRPRRPESVQMMYAQQNAYGGMSYQQQQQPGSNMPPSNSQFVQPYGGPQQMFQQQMPPNGQQTQAGGGMQFQPTRSSSLDPKISEQIRAMTQGGYDNSRMSSLNMGSRASQVFAQNPSLAPPGNPPGIYNGQQPREFAEYDDDDGYEDMDSDSDAMGSDVLRNTEYNAMIDVGLADVMESDAFIPSRPQKPGPKRNVVFAQFVEEIPDSGDDEDYDDELEDEDDDDEQSANSQQDNYTRQPFNQVPLQPPHEPDVRPDSNDAERPAISQRMSSLVHGPIELNRNSMVAPPEPNRQMPPHSQEISHSQQIHDDASSTASTGIQSSGPSTSSTVASSPSPQPSRSRKKVRHVQIQTRGPQYREVQIQTDPVTFSLPAVSKSSTTPPPTSEREQALEAENKKLSEQCSTFNSQLTSLQSSYQSMQAELEALRESFRNVSSEKEQMAWKLEDDKSKFDKLSQQALKKIRELLNERQVLEIEIDGLRGQVDALEEQHREWQEDDVKDAEGAMEKRKSKVLSQRFSMMPPPLSNGIMT